MECLVMAVVDEGVVSIGGWNGSMAGECLVMAGVDDGGLGGFNGWVERLATAWGRGRPLMEWAPYGGGAGGGVRA